MKIALICVFLLLPAMAFAQFSGPFRTNLSSAPAAFLTAQHVLGFGVVDNNTGAVAARAVLGFSVIRIE